MQMTVWMKKRPNEAPYKMHIHDAKAVDVLILGQTWLHKVFLNLYTANLQCQTTAHDTWSFFEVFFFSDPPHVTKTPK